MLIMVESKTWCQDCVSCCRYIAGFPLLCKYKWKVYFILTQKNIKKKLD